VSTWIPLRPRWPHGGQGTGGWIRCSEYELNIVANTGAAGQRPALATAEQVFLAQAGRTGGTLESNESKRKEPASPRGRCRRASCHRVRAAGGRFTENRTFRRGPEAQLGPDDLQLLFGFKPLPG